ncbi:MAG: CDP-alcohol phosphatidyltransferase family protein [Chloroflexota bacterium]
MLNLARLRQPAANYLTRPVVRWLARLAVTPDALTWLGFLITVGAALLIVSGRLVLAGVMVLVAGYFDILDGARARHTGRVSRFGGVLDSVLDRLSEGALLVGLLLFYARQLSVLMVVLAGLALLGSLLVSYIRARAEAAGLECRVGAFTRTERVVVLVLGLWLSQLSYALTAALAIIVVASFITAGQRLVCVWQQTREG